MLRSGSREREHGEAPVTLRISGATDRARPAFSTAQILPARGMMTLQITAWLPARGETDLLFPDIEEAQRILEGDPGSFPGNRSYRVGGAILLPYANRIRGKLSPDGRTILAEALGKPLRLPANASGSRPGAERFAMHGLILAERAALVSRDTTDQLDSVQARLEAGDFGGGWFSSTEIDFRNILTPDSFTLRVEARNVGVEPLPMGIGWHPYFNIPSGQRQQARLVLPARARAVANNYDEVLPTGEVQPVAGTPFDFSPPGGRSLDDLALDDCFVDLAPEAGGQVVAKLIDPAAGYGLRLTTTSPPVRAFQVYAPPRERFVALEPQLNWPDPFGPQWAPGIDTGMVILQPGESVAYSARLELFTPSLEPRFPRPESIARPGSIQEVPGENPGEGTELSP
jgi:galactose mutarotase-like enzyme